MYIFGMSPLSTASGKNEPESNIFSVNFYGSKLATPSSSAAPMDVDGTPPMVIDETPPTTIDEAPPMVIDETQPVLSFHVRSTQPKPNGEPNYELVPEEFSETAPVIVDKDEIVRGMQSPIAPSQVTNFRIICRVCSRSYKSKKRYENHLEGCAILTQAKNLFNCYVCRLQTNMKALLKHQQYHIKRSKLKSLPEGNHTQLKTREVTQPTASNDSLPKTLHQHQQPSKSNESLPSTVHQPRMSNNSLQLQERKATRPTMISDSMPRNMHQPRQPQAMVRSDSHPLFVREPTQPTVHHRPIRTEPAHQVQPPALAEPRKPSIFHSIELLAISDRKR